MTTFFTVIGLVMRLKTSSLTTYGDAIYRTDENYTFAVKQFTNARHEYNEAYIEGDLVMFGGKFTIDDQEKIMVNIIYCFYVNKNSLIIIYIYLMFFCMNSLL
jgi:TRAP-type mannitol/chloroaromatic compound transport system permease small subunit